MAFYVAILQNKVSINVVSSRSIVILFYLRDAGNRAISHLPGTLIPPPQRIARRANRKLSAYALHYRFVTVPASRCNGDINNYAR